MFVFCCVFSLVTCHLSTVTTHHPTDCLCIQTDGRTDNRCGHNKVFFLRKEQYNGVQMVFKWCSNSVQWCSVRLSLAFRLSQKLEFFKFTPVHLLSVWVCQFCPSVRLLSVSCCLFAYMHTDGRGDGRCGHNKVLFLMKQALKWCSNDVQYCSVRRSSASELPLGSVDAPCTIRANDAATRLRFSFEMQMRISFHKKHIPKRR